MDALALLLSLALPWCAGCVLLRIVGWPGPASSTVAMTAGSPGGAKALTLGYGYFIGLLILTVWMRILSIAGVGFGRLTIGLPLAAVVAGSIVYLSRRRGISLDRVRAAIAAVVRPPLPRWQQALWIALCAWLAFRFASLAVEIAERPLYPWEAWTQWATKARVWHALGHIASFASADAWLSGNGDAYFDASPASPATVPLLQVWSVVALGRWDDTATNWPWLAMMLALALSVYGMLRDRGLSLLAAMIGAYLVTSLPFLDTHVALAGYADLMLAGVYTLAALAFHRWVTQRRPVDGILAIVLAVTCPFIDVSGRIWMATLIPGIFVALLPRQGLKTVGWIWAAALLLLVAFARETPLFGGFTLHPVGSWRAIGEAFFLSDHWHLLWFVAAALAIVGARRLVQPSLVPLTAIAGSVLAWLIVAAMFSADVARWFPVAAVLDRGILIVAPVVVFLGVLLWHELTAPRESAGVAGAEPTHA